MKGENGAEGDTREGYLVLSGASSHALPCPSRRPPLLTPQKETGAVPHGVPAFHPQRVHQISNEACVESKSKGIVSGLLSRFLNLHRVRCCSTRSRRCQHIRKSSGTPCPTTPSLPTSSHLRTSPARQEDWWANSTMRFPDLFPVWAQ